MINIRMIKLPNTNWAYDSGTWPLKNTDMGINIDEARTTMCTKVTKFTPYHEISYFAIHLIKSK
ncbi:hypothetical protein CD29_18700 [Ureibacillus manganicus DSM 26584]|uniref:Uncharacterized protein n=1 Tax=Ureibacillus manganicus DSM 26584 TaxID=1384049 RepID=A0A0A3HT28_9BACL|nr:hypothetical protein CD29_18700 [Ureibacillus manganicus DSM 26584]